MSPRYKSVIVEGIPGVGKTVLSDELATALDAQDPESRTLYLPEPDEKNNANPYLADYYHDEERWAFTMQIHLLQARFRAHLEVQWHVMANRGHGVLDRSYFGDVAFAYVQRDLGYMSPREFDSYRDLYHCMTAHVLYPNICLHLDVDPEVALHRIQTRMQDQKGRNCEREISIDYLRHVDEATRATVAKLADRGTFVVEVPWNENRDTPEKRNGEIGKLAGINMDHQVRREFSDIYERVQ